MTRSFSTLFVIALTFTAYGLPGEKLPSRYAATLEAMPEKGEHRISVSFRQPAPVAVLRQFAENQKLTALTYEWKDQKAVYVTQPGDSLELVAAKFAERLTTVLQNNSGIADAEQQLADLRTYGVAVSAIEIEGSRLHLREAVDDIRHAGHGSLIEDVDLSTITNPQPARVDVNSTHARVETLAGAPYPNDPWRFSPSSGSLTHNANNKTISSTFRWTDVSGFDSIHRGYEHDIVVTGVTGFASGTDSLYWSNLPSWYIDDYAMDTTPTLTIGTAQATSILAHTDYKVIVAYKVGTQDYSAVTGRLDLRPQLGSWAGAYDEGDSPGESGETFYCQTRGLGIFARNCIFADQTNFLVKLYESTAASAPLYTFAPFNVTQTRTFWWNKDITNASKACGSQYLAEYYKGNAIDEKKLIFVRCEPAVSQNWGTSGPEGDMKDNFAVRWSGWRHFSGGRYRFTVRHDDGAVLRVGGSPPLYDLRSGPLKSATTDLQLSPGTYNIITEYYEGADTASVVMGWEAISTTPSVALTEGAEGGAPGWSLGGWIVQTSASSYGSRRFLIGNGTSYTHYMNASLTSPAFSLVGRSSARLTYAYKFDTEPNYDFFWVEVSGDGGWTWTMITSKRSGLSPNGAYWSSADVALPSTVLGKSNVKVRFRFTSDGSIYRWGAAVDEIRVVAQ